MTASEISSRLAGAHRASVHGGPKGPPSAPPTVPPIIINPFHREKPAPAIDPRHRPPGPPLMPPRRPDQRIARLA
jgi:hypothetical protein